MEIKVRTNRHPIVLSNNSSPTSNNTQPSSRHQLIHAMQSTQNPQKKQDTWKKQTGRCSETNTTWTQQANCRGNKGRGEKNTIDFQI